MGDTVIPSGLDSSVTNAMLQQSTKDVERKAIAEGISANNRTMVNMDLARNNKATQAAVDALNAAADMSTKVRL